MAVKKFQQPQNMQIINPTKKNKLIENAENCYFYQKMEKLNNLPHS